MKLSYEWLKEYVDIKANVKKLADGLTMSGSEVEAVSDVSSDKVMDLEITSNRPDCLSIIGLAREASAVFDKDLKMPEMKVAAKKATAKEPTIKCTIKDTKLCPKYTARVITGVKVKGIGQGINKRITAMGLRPVNNIVDITNFCLMELGQPLHAFDLDKIKGGQVIIRKAVKGEKIKTIDGEERELEPGMLVIADEKDPIAVAGVMGGMDTEVSAATKNMLLESAYFDPISIRQTARKLGLSSDSSYRFERGVDKGMIEKASDRAAALIVKEAGGEVGAFYNAGKLATKSSEIKFDTEKASKILGVSLDVKEAKRIFKRLDIKIKKESGKKLTVIAPTFREDLKKEIDLVEEVARIYGYDKIPAVVEKVIPQVKRKDHSRLVGEKLRSMLPAEGLSEIMTYSLVSEAAVKTFSAISKDTVELINPLSEEQKVLTPHLLDGMFRTAAWNINRKNRDFGLFEIGKLYSRPQGKARVKETPALCLGLTGILRKNWQDGEREATIFDLKGIIETALGTLKVKMVFSSTKMDGLVNCAEISLGKKKIGFLGEADTRILKEYDIPQPVYIAQIELLDIIKEARLDTKYHAVPRFPSSSRDISVLCDKTLAASEVSKVVADTGADIIRSIDLVDVYEGRQVPGDKKSLTYSINYGLPTRTLTDEEIEAIHSSIKENLVKSFQVSFR